MRKRTINSLFDTIFWYAIYLIPVIAYIYFTLVSPYNATSSFTMFFENLGISFVSDNIIFTSLKAIFGVGGVIPLFSSDVPFIIFTWFICCFMVHLAVDVILFIPRYFHEILNKSNKGD